MQKKTHKRSAATSNMLRHARTYVIASFAGSNLKQRINDSKKKWQTQSDPKRARSINRTNLNDIDHSTSKRAVSKCRASKVTGSQKKSKQASQQKRKTRALNTHASTAQLIVKHAHRRSKRSCGLMRCIVQLANEGQSQGQKKKNTAGQSVQASVQQEARVQTGRQGDRVSR